MRYLFTVHRLWQRLQRGLILGVIISGIFALLLSQGFFTTWRTSFKDALYQGSNSSPTAGIITMVAIDDASLNALGRSPSLWSRDAHADLLDILGEGRAKAIAFDILFAEPSENDDRLLQALQEANQGIPGEKLPTTVIQPVGGLQRVAQFMSVGEVITYTQFITPTKAISTASQDRFGRQYLGHVNVLPDSDGFVRQIPLVVQDTQGQRYPTLGLAAYLGFIGFSPDEVDYQMDEVIFSGRRIQTDSNSQMLIYFFDQPAQSGQMLHHKFPVYSYIDVLCSHRPDADYFMPDFNCATRSNPIEVPLSAFQGDLVFIGVLGAVAEPDSFPVPIAASNEPMFGVEIHANVAENIHQALPTVGRKLPLVEQPLSEQMVILFSIGIIGGLVYSVVRWYLAVILAGVTYAIYFVVAVQLFQQQAVVMDLFFPLLTLISLLFAVFISNYVFEERRRSQINDLFQRYVSPEIARKIVEIADQGKLDLSGEEREITVMFADVRGFTTLSEGLAPKEVVELLNTFLERMNSIVLANGGAINKYIGDNLMAFWNAPYPQEDHAWLAVQAGLEIMRAVDELNATGQFKTLVQFGIGINTGQAVVGNIGSTQRLEYTPIGDTVNVASRLSGVALGGSVLVGEGTYEALAGRLTPHQAHEITLKGKSYPVRAYEYRID